MAMVTKERPVVELAFQGDHRPQSACKPFN